MFPFLFIPLLITIPLTTQETCPHHHHHPLKSYPEITVSPLNATTADGPIGHLSLICSAPYPVQWGFQSFQLWTPWSTSTSRNGSTFQAILGYQRLRNITQLRNDYPTCHGTNSTCVQTSLFVRFDGVTHLLEERRGSDLQLNPSAEFGKNSNCSLRIAYDQESQTFYCQSMNLSQVATIFPRACSNPVECSRVYQEADCPSPAPPTISYADCSATVGCVKMTYAADSLPAVAICLVRRSENELMNSVALPFVYSLDTHDTTSRKRYLTWQQIEAEKMLQISNQTQVYAGQEFQIQCNASYYYFSSGLLLEITYKNETRDLVAEERIIYQQTTGKNGVLTELEYLRLLASDNVLSAPGNYSIECHAPVWNTTEWISMGSFVTVLESTAPMFFSGNDSETLPYKPNKVIHCAAQGVPPPVLSWSYNDASLPPKLVISNGSANGTSTWTNLRLPSYGIYGNFTCMASNYAGSVEKTFVVVPPDQTTSALIVIIVLSVLGLILTPSVLFLVFKVRQQNKQLLTQEEVDEFLLGKPDIIPFQCDMSTYAYYLPYDKSFEIDKSDLDIDFNQILGQGAYGMVVYGTYKTMKVAVKTTKPLDYGMDMFKALLSELKIMTFIGKNEYTVNLIGACTASIQKKQVYIALEYCENGSLLSFLRTHRHAFINPAFVEDTPSPLTRQPSFLNCPHVQYVKMEDLSHIAIHNQHEYANMFRIGRGDLLRWAFQVAEGMRYLNGKKVIHGDLAARNILLTENLTAKICDFGLSKRLLHYNSYTRTATTPLPIKWLAIECLQDFQFSAESDIWSYGVTLWEIFSLGEIPYSSFNGNGEEFLQRLSRGMRLMQPAYCSEDVFSVMMSCWKHNRKQRPKFNALSEFFKKCID